MRRMLFVLVMALTLCGCKTVSKVEKEYVAVRDTVYKARDMVRVDTLLWHDSVVVRVDGVDRWHTRYRVREVAVRDTVYQNHTDTLVKVREVRVEKHRSWWERVREGAVWLVVGVVAGIVGRMIVRRSNPL